METGPCLNLSDLIISYSINDAIIYDEQLYIRYILKPMKTVEYI